MFVGLLDDLCDLRDLINAHERIHFRKQLRQFVTEPLRQASRDDQSLAAVFGFAQRLCRHCAHILFREIFNRFAKARQTLQPALYGFWS